MKSGTLSGPSLAPKLSKANRNLSTVCNVSDTACVDFKASMNEPSFSINSSVKIFFLCFCHSVAPLNVNFFERPPLCHRATCHKMTTVLEIQ